MKQEILYHFRKAVEKVADEYLSKFQNDPHEETIKAVIKGFLKYLFDETAY